MTCSEKTARNYIPTITAAKDGGGGQVFKCWMHGALQYLHLCICYTHLSTDQTYQAQSNNPAKALLKNIVQPTCYIRIRDKLERQMDGSVGAEGQMVEGQMTDGQTVRMQSDTTKVSGYTN
jgi:hypothetical protein